MANYRQLHTKTWVDSWFMELSPEQKLLFIHLFSNQRASACGLYEMPIRVMSFETGLAPETIKKCLEVYNDADKVYYDFQTSVIWIVNMPKYQSSTSPKLRARIEADIKAVPDCELKSRFLDKYPELTLPIPYRYGIDTLQSVSVSNSDSVSVEEGGVGGETKDDRRPETGDRQENKTKSKKQKELWTDDALPGNNVEAEFIDHFGSFNGKNEKQRWQTLVECIGLERAQEIAAWAERKEIHMMNRGALMDSLETAAKKWTEKARPPESGGRSGKITPEERQARSTENIRKGLEMAFAQDEQHRSQEISPRIPCESWDYLAPCPVREPGLLRRNRDYFAPCPVQEPGLTQEPGLPRPVREPGLLRRNRDYHGFRHTDAIFKLERGSRLRWSLGYGGSAGDPGECVSRGAAAGRGVGGVFSDSCR
ncbi:MAG: hypothetical protein Q8O43_10155 [Dehalococcoidia bacterium]|nr:hypothetical protein [Dehalococcoidia bacterium]